MIKDLQAIDPAATVTQAEQALDRCAGNWDSKYPTLSKPGRLRWAEITALFAFLPAIRKASDTTKASASVTRAIRKFPRNRKPYPRAESAVKLLDLAIGEASRKWTMPSVGWKQAGNPWASLFAGRWPLNRTP